VTGMVVQPNKAIVGANAFVHEAGIHQDGMLKHHDTYEIMRPETVGAGQSRLVLGKHSGRHAVRARLSELGYRLEDEHLDAVFARFKGLADRKKTITDADLEALVADIVRAPEALYTLEDLQVACGTMGMPTATVRLRGPDGRVETRAAIGTGPVDAAYKAIDGIVGTDVRLLEFHVHSVTEGIDALGEVTVKVQGEAAPPARHPQRESGEPRVYLGHGAATDIVVAGVKAYLAAINKYLSMEMGHTGEAAARASGGAGDEARTAGPGAGA
jgi:2-isopropylmalate synthase